MWRLSFSKGKGEKIIKLYTMENTRLESNHKITKVLLMFGYIVSYLYRLINLVMKLLYSQINTLMLQKISYHLFLNSHYIKISVFVSIFE